MTTEYKNKENPVISMKWFILYYGGIFFVLKMSSCGLFEWHSRIVGNRVYDISGQGTVQTALSGAYEALLVRQGRSFMRSELCGIYENCSMRRRKMSS